MEFGSAIPGTANQDYAIIDTRSIDYMVASGLNTIRLPFLWERVQLSANGSLNSVYLGHIFTTVEYITISKGIYCLLDNHNYARYYGNIATNQEFANVWTQLAMVFKNNTNVIFGLMNEPNSMAYTTVLSMMQAGIDAIRATGATNLITVAGNDWTGVHSWTNGNSAVMGNITDPLNNWMYEMHQYFDDNYSGTSACDPSSNVNNIFGPATAWLRSNHKTAFLGEFGLENTTGCMNLLTEVMTYLADNDDVWKGFTWWSAGPWWGTYMYSIEPKSYNPDVSNGMQLLFMSEGVNAANRASTASATTAGTVSGSRTTGRISGTTGGSDVIKATGNVSTGCKESAGLMMVVIMSILALFL